MQPEDIRRLRLLNQGILSPMAGTPAAVVARLGAMQAQEYQMAQWAVGLRAEGLTATDVEDAFARGEILRTHLLRPTWHFVVPDDIRWLLRLTAPHVHRLNAFMYRREGLDPDTLRTAAGILERSLAATPEQTRNELAEVLSQHGLSASGHRLSYIMMYAELEGILCSGPRRGKQFTYALLEQKAPMQNHPTREEALAHLAERYFATRGPATTKDFATWSGLPTRDARTASASLSARFVREGDYHLLQPPTVLPINAHATFLMPDYDEYGMSYKDREVLSPMRPPPEPPPLTSHWLVIAGRIEGTWCHPPDKRASAEALPYHPLDTEAQAEVEQGVARYREFWGV